MRFQSWNWGSGLLDHGAVLAKPEAPRGARSLLSSCFRLGIWGSSVSPFRPGQCFEFDKNPPIECREARYCVFPSIQALAALKQLKIGSLVLVDVYTEKGQFSFSLTPKGFQAGMAQIRAWGYRTE